MTTRLILTLLCLLAPLVAGAETLDMYGNLTGKTVLRPTALPRLPEAIVADLPSDKTNAIAHIERALAEQGLEVVQDGPHFVRVFSKGMTGSLTNAPLRGAELAGLKRQETTNSQETIPSGMIEFVLADLNQVLSIYAFMSQRTVLRPISLPSPAVSLKTQCALSKEEALYAFTTVLALNGIRVAEDGAKFVQMVPMPSQVITGAPPPEPGAKLFDPKKVPSVGAPRWSKAAAPPPKPLTERERLEQVFERLQNAFDDFLHPADPRKPDARRLFELYAGLADKTAMASPKVDGTSIWFRVETPLTKAELIYAIETTFRLHNLAIIPVDDHKIRLGHISETFKWNGKRLENVLPKR
jgi:hypothetical protein